jgi:hypothetical protein
MKEIGNALPWVAFWLVVALYIWVEYKLCAAGHSTLLFTHKTPEEKRLREAATRKAEREVFCKGTDK